jgi:transcriptional regulator with XRE-family HTH domain
MKHNKPDRIDRLLQLAYLEQRITTHGAYEKSALRKKASHKFPPGSEKRLEERLVGALENHVADAVELLTIGGFLKSVRIQQELRPQELFSRIGVSPNIYKMLEHDRISPLKVPVESWKKFGRLFDLPAERLTEMIRRTHQLVFFQPSLRTTLARYDARRNSSMKKEALARATQELYLRANLELPVDEQQKLYRLLKAIGDAE